RPQARSRPAPAGRAGVASRNGPEPSRPPAAPPRVGPGRRGREPGTRPPAGAPGRSLKRPEPRGETRSREGTADRTLTLLHGGEKVGPTESPVDPQPRRVESSHGIAVMKFQQQWFQVAALFDCVDDVLAWVKDRDGCYRWVNRAFLINYSL